MMSASVPPPREARHSPHSPCNRAARAAWSIVYAIVFRYSPRPLHRWRNLLLRIFGAQVHPTARVYPRARIWAPWNLVMEEGACIGDDVDVYSVDRISLGAWSTVSQYSYLCAASHDFEDVQHPLITAPIVIGRRCWIAADVFVAPGVTIGEGSVVGARSSVFSDLPEWMVCAGTPAKPLHPRKIRATDFADAAGAQNKKNEQGEPTPDIATNNEDRP